MRIHLAKQFNRGVTLVEVVIATAIIAVTGAAVISSINYGLLVIRIARENQRATQVMLERLESIRLYSWDQVTNNAFIPTTFTEAYAPSGSTNSQGVTFFGTMTVGTPVFSGTAPSYAPFMRQFTVTLQWTNGGTIRHSRSLTTYVSRDGEQNYVY
jgi:prepilin-type N-terminal cleavage/methylation domain-containing protein